MTQALAALRVAVCLCLLGSSAPQPTACRHDVQCPAGTYCQPDQLLCRECLRCEDLKRSPLPYVTSCIKSVADCGPCEKGLVEDRGDANAQCVPRTERDVNGGFPLYGWVLIAILCILVLGLFGGIVWYVLKHPDTLKILASTSTSMQSRCERSVIPATAPEHPPPYNALYTAVPGPPLATPPVPSPPANDLEYQPYEEESSRPFIKRAPSGRAWEARESAGSQAARVYNNPAYVRSAQLPNGYESAVMKSVKGPEVMDHDEDTMESMWTPSENADQGDSNANSSSAASGGEGGAAAGAELPALLAAARSTALVRAPPRARQDANNNGSRSTGEPSPACGEGGGAAAHGSFIINVVQTIHAVQRGDAAH